MKQVFVGIFCWCVLPALKAQLNIVVEGNKVINTMKGGMGATFFPMNDSIPIVNDISYGGSAWGGVPNSNKEQAWQQIYHHLDWLGLDWCRVEIEHRIFEPAQGRFTWESDEMKNLYRFLDYCEQHGVDVFFQERYPNVAWLTPTAWQHDDVLKVQAAPTNEVAWADGLTALLKHLTATKKYTCIKWLGIVNEPEASWSWWKEYPSGRSRSITPALALMKQKLALAKIDIPLSGPGWSIDVNGGYRYMDFKQSIGAYDLHSYNAKPDWWTKPFKWQLGTMRLHERIFKPYIDTAHAESKPFFLTEFGSFYQGFDRTSAMPTDYYSVLKDVQMVVRFSNLGVDGFNKWSLLNRGDLDGQWQFINTWDTLHHCLLAKFTPHKNQYYVFGLVTRLVPKYASVLQTSLQNLPAYKHQRVYAATYKSSKGNYSIVIVNDDALPYTATLQLRNLVNSKPLYRYTVTEADKDKENVTIQPQLIASNKAAIYRLTIPANSVQVISTYHLLMSDKGIVVD